MMRPQVRLPHLSAALAGIPAGVQTVGPWSGRRQLFVRFALEAETATIYTSDALRNELTRLSGRSHYHSIAIVGGDALSEGEFLAAAFKEAPALRVMIDHDGQRPEALDALLHALALVQVTLDGSEGAAWIERACATIALAAKRQVDNAVAILPGAAASDGPLLRIVEQIHDASADAQIVLHPIAERVHEHDRRWVLWLEQAMAVHPDVRVLSRWPVTGGTPQEHGTRNAHSG